VKDRVAAVGSAAFTGSHALKQLVPVPVKRAAKAWLYGPPDAADRLPSVAFLETLMRRYRSDRLADVPEAQFQGEIERFLALRSGEVTGATEPGRQRDLSQAFRWGHDHDFGTFRLQGAMGARHLRHLAVFIDQFGALPRQLDGRRVLDIGCWTGGTSLLLAAMGARVTAIDEVGMYVDCLNYLARAFAVPDLEARRQSLYGCTTPELQDRFDVVLFAGVLYHVTDPVLALRILFNCLKDGGVCLIETTGVRSRRAIISYERRVWNWFDLSPAALHQMLSDVGFAGIEVGRVTGDGRLYATARRERHVDMRRDGLSVPTIR
jgi:2-polyprenyl-3-methyl-5-hydroxy-6-metoxy-1,4-benzoquinol methylase